MRICTCSGEKNHVINAADRNRLSLPSAAAVGEASFTANIHHLIRITDPETEDVENHTRC